MGVNEEHSQDMAPCSEETDGSDRGDSICSPVTFDFSDENLLSNREDECDRDHSILELHHPHNNRADTYDRPFEETFHESENLLLFGHAEEEKDGVGLRNDAKNNGGQTEVPRGNLQSRVSTTSAVNQSSNTTEPSATWQSDVSVTAKGERSIHALSKEVHALSNDEQNSKTADQHEATYEKGAKNPKGLVKHEAQGEMPPSAKIREERGLSRVIENVGNTDDNSVVRLSRPQSPLSRVGEYESPPVLMRPGTIVMTAPPVGVPQQLPYTYTIPQAQPGFVPQIPTAIYTHAPVPAPHQIPSVGNGRRKITLRLEEDRPLDSNGSFFFRSSTRFLTKAGSLRALDGDRGLDRGSIIVSWYDGTSSTELQEHVRRSVVRKMSLSGSATLRDLRIIDESMVPPEEIVLSPYIPDGSRFLLRFTTKVTDQDAPSARSGALGSMYSAPQSPSAAPSPFPSSSELTRLDEQLLKAGLNSLKNSSKKSPFQAPNHDISKPKKEVPTAALDRAADGSSLGAKANATEDSDVASKGSEFHEDDVMGYNPEDQIEQRIRQLADLLVADRKQRYVRRSREKRQVVFVLANYFVLFLSLIAISAEIQARAPKWSQYLEAQFKNVQKCATDQDSLFECVSKGDFAGLMASFILFLSRSAATKRFFLFGFESPKRLWTVVYEALVTAVCWGVSYLLIRRGMNPDTRSNFLRKYWKDAVYGSLAGFNASFMKAVLKNLIPQEALEDALQERQLKILSWLPSFN